MSKVKKLIILSIIYSLVNMTLLFGQNANPQVINIPSPNTASLGIYGEVPVSKFTGIPSIDIPLNNINAENVSLPITLSYHVGANRIDQHPGWVGMGWSLDCSGVISRVVKNYPDEFAYDLNNISYIPPTPDGKLGYYYNTNYLNTTNWQTPNVNYTTSTGNPFRIPDLEPDEFSFNFLGNSGKFYLNQDGTWKVISNKPIEVEFDGEMVNPFIKNYGGYISNNDLTKTFKHFKIRDEDGNQYLFGSFNAGDNDYAIEYGMPMSNSATVYSMFNASAWYLTKIILAKGAQEIIYKYARGPFTGNIMYAGSYSINSASNPANFPVSGSSSCFSSGPTSGGSYAINLTGSYNAPVYLEEIIYPSKNLKIKFNTSRCYDMNYPKEFYTSIVDITNNPFWSVVKSVYASGIIPQFVNGYFYSGPPRDFPTDHFFWLQLNNIEFLKNSDASQLSKVTFVYDDGSTAQRLRPIGINIAGRTAVTVQKYSFDYYDHLSMPRYLFGITDHWGYWTSATAAASVTQETTNLLNIRAYLNNNFNSLTSPTSVLRTPDFNGTLAGALKTITYPTGGSTLFEYELNEYSQYVNSNNRSQLHAVANTITGGLRVKKITTSFLTQTPQVKEFFYKSDFISSPSSPQGLSSSGILNVLPLYQSGAITTHNGVTVSTSSISFSPVIPLTYNSSGSHIGYSEVTEKTTSNGFTISKFTNHNTAGSQDLAPLNSTFLDFEPVKNYSSMAHNRGLPLVEEAYNQNNSLVKKTEMEYDIIGDANTDFCRAYKHRVINFCQPLINPVWATIPYKVPYYEKMLTKKTDYVKNQTDNNFLITEENYTYTTGNIKLIKTITTNNSAGNQQKVELSYPFNSILAPYPEMTSLHMIAPVIEKSTSINNQIILNETNKYKKWGPNVFALENLQFQKGTTAEQVTKMVYSDYDNIGNPLSITKDQYLNTVYIWGYNKQYPVAKIIGTTYANAISFVVDQTILENPASDISLRTELNYIRTGLANTNAQVFTYTYSPLIGITSETDANNRTTYYEYDTYNRLTIVRDQDQNILKKFCYNYAGQIIDCNTPCNPNVPVWQNTTEVRCQTIGCSTTGYQEVRQINVSPCATPGQEQWVATYNPSACPVSSFVQITYQSATAGYTATYTNTRTGQVYTFVVPSGIGTIGCIPSGSYNLTLQPTGVGLVAIFENGCSAVSGTSATFYIRNLTFCNQIKINADLF